MNAIPSLLAVACALFAVGCVEQSKCSDDTALVQIDEDLTQDQVDAAGASDGDSGAPSCETVCTSVATYALKVVSCDLQPESEDSVDSSHLTCAVQAEHHCAR